MKDEKIKYMFITLGQQGGIGYPPMIVQIKNKWYAVEDSRDRNIPDECYNVLYRDRYPRHSQSWALKKFRNGPYITMSELIKKIGKIKKYKEV